MSEIIGQLNSMANHKQEFQKYIYPVLVGVMEFTEFDVGVFGLNELVVVPGAARLSNLAHVTTLVCISPARRKCLP